MSGETRTTILDTVQSPTQPLGAQSRETWMGPWLILKDIGQGGQGNVRLGRRQRTEELGAVKQPAGARGATEKGLERFTRERAALIALKELEHRFIVPLLDAGRAPDARPSREGSYFVMAYAPLGSLHHCVREFAGDAVAVLRLCRRIASGLGAAHEMGFIHRDVKPKNILLAAIDHPWIADFGVVYRIDQESITSSQVGSDKFAPPEYDEIEDPPEPTPAFDVFSLGAVLHFSIWGGLLPRQYRKYGRLPSVGREGANPEQFRPVDDLIAWMTHPNRDKRPQRMQEVIDEIDLVIGRYNALLSVRHEANEKEREAARMASLAKPAERQPSSPPEPRVVIEVPAGPAATEVALGGRTRTPLLSRVFIVGSSIVLALALVWLLARHHRTASAETHNAVVGHSFEPVVPVTIGSMAFLPLFGASSSVVNSSVAPPVSASLDPVPAAVHPRGSQPTSHRLNSASAGAKWVQRAEQLERVIE